MKKEDMTSYKDTKTELHEEQVLLISFSSDADDAPISGNSFSVLNRMTM